MAAKESAGTQAIIITLAIVSLLSIVGLFLLNNARKTAVARATSAENDLTASRNAQGQLQAEANTYKQWMGFPENDSLTSLQERYSQDMQEFGQAFSEENQQYSTILASISEENRTLVQNESNARAEIAQLQLDLKAVEAAKEVQVKQFEAAMKAAVDDAATEKQKFDQNYAALNQEKDEIKQQLQQQLAQLDDMRSAMESQKGDFDARVNTLESSIQKLRDGLPEVDQFAQPADGRLTWVNQGSQTAWINLGSADGLRPQVTFSVAEAGLGDAEGVEKKGSIEVVRIVGPHQAEVHITEDDPKNPLMPNDRVYSQVWDRGRQVGFGIAGFVDLDRDGVSDLERLKAIISASNGRVDAAPTSTGEKEGELRVDTRFLVLGGRPSDPRLAAFRQSWQELSDEAETLGVETIAVDEFLRLMGWQSESRSVSMGSDYDLSDFPVSTNRDIQPPSELPARTENVFKRRLPPTTY